MYANILVISEKMANVFIEECKDSCSLTFAIIIQKILKRHCNSLSDLVVDLFKLIFTLNACFNFPILIVPVFQNLITFYFFFHFQATT